MRLHATHCVVSAMIACSGLIASGAIAETVRLQNLNSGKFLAVAGSAQHNGGNVIQWDDVGQRDIRWEIVVVRPGESGKDAVRIRNLNSNRFLAVSGGSRRSGANVLQWADVGQKDVNWRKDPAKTYGNRCFRFRNLGTGKFLAVSGGSRRSGANVVQWTDEGQRDLVWCMK